MILQAFGFVLGVVVLYQLSRVPAVAWVVVPVLIACYAAFRRSWVALFFSLGLLWSYGYSAAVLEERLDPRLVGRDVVVEGRVTSLPQRSDRAVRFQFHVEALILPEAAVLPARIRLAWYGQETVRAGERWRFKVRLKRPRGTFNPGGFDYEGWLFGKRIAATGYVRKDRGNRLLDEGAGRPFGGNWRQVINDRLTVALEQSPMGGIVKALTLGVRHDIDQSQWEVLRRTGTSHLIAISGLHIGLVAGLAYGLVLRFWAYAGFLGWAPPRVAAAAAVLAALGYAAMADFSIPTQRALIMIAVVMGGIGLQRRLRPGHVLASAMLAVVIYDPPAVLAPGFWLSFFAVGLIHYACSGRLGGRGYWDGLVRIHWVTAAGLSPVLILFFQQVSVIAPLANFVAVPVVSLLVVPGCLIGAAVLGFSPALGEGLLTGVALLLEHLWAVLSVFSSLPLAQVEGPQPPVWAFLLALCGVVVLLAPRGVPARWLGLVCWLPIVATRTPVPEQGELWLTLLDVGQGLATVLQTRNHTLVFDTGARFSDRFDMGDAVVAPFLRHGGIEKIDTLVISHGDNDHSGGSASLLRLFPVAKIYSSVPQRFDGVAARACRAGQEWIWDDVRFTMLAPGNGSPPGGNNRSCVLKAEGPGGTVLLTGDIEQDAEAWLLDHYGAALNSDVVVVPHHGSRTSSVVGFLNAVEPDIALIPAGYRNRFGFPHRVVLERYRAIGARIFNTAHSGAIKVELAPGEPVRHWRHRQEKGRLWNAPNDLSERRFLGR